MKKILLPLLLIALTACSDTEPPVMIESIQRNPLMGGIMVKIVSLDDQLVVEGATANRGNCKVREKALDGTSHYPKKLKYGRSGFIHIGGCDLIEITIETNLGDWDFDYE